MLLEGGDVLFAAKKFNEAETFYFHNQHGHLNQH